MTTRLRTPTLTRLSLAMAAVVVLAAAVGPALAITLPPTRAGVYVYDLANIWTEATTSAAENTITAIRDRTQAQIAVVSWPTSFSSVSTGEARADAIRIMDTWGVGRAGVNDGLVVLFDMDDTLQHGQIYLYAGSGFLDKYLSEDESAAIVHDAMLPKAKDGDLDGALLAGLERVDHVVQPNGNPDRGTQAILHALIAAALAGGALAVFGLFVLTWWRRGRDARIPTIDDSVLLPAPPPDLTPALAAVLRRDKVDSEAFTAALVDLGHRNLVSFAEHGGLIGGHTVDLVIPDETTVDAAAEDARKRPLGPAERALADQIRTRAGGTRITAAELKSGAGKKLLDAFRTAIGKAAVGSGWFKADPNQVMGTWAGAGVGLVVVAAVVFFIFAIDKSDDSSRLLAPGADYLVAPLAIGLVLGIAIIVLDQFLVARTESGAQTLAMALAYRNTLRFEIAQSQTIGQAVERTTSRLPWITTPDELTVWAVALGLKDEVDHLIKDTFKHDPQGAWAPIWYTGAGGFGSIGNVSSMLSSISTTSASSSGSGYGGGSSGGGGGSGGGF